MAYLWLQAEGFLTDSHAGAMPIDKHQLALSQLPKRPRLFFDTPSNICVAVTGMYLVITAGYVLLAAPLPPGIAVIPQSGILAFLDEYVPAIRWSIDRLTEDGNPDRAALVARSFAFAWATGLVGMALQTLILLWAVLRATPDELHTSRVYGLEVERRLPEYAGVAWKFALGLGFFALVDAAVTPYGYGIFSSFLSFTSFDVQKQIDFTIVLIAYPFVVMAAIQHVWIRQRKQSDTLSPPPESA